MLQAAYHASRVKRPLLQEQAALILSRTVTALANAVFRQPAQVSKPEAVDGFFSPSIAAPSRPKRQRVALPPVAVDRPPKASTSKLVETPPITNVNNLIRSHKRLLSQLRAVTDIIETLPAAHLTPAKGLVLVYPHLRRLQARIRASETNLPSHALPWLEAGSAQYAEYLLHHIFPNMKAMPPEMLECAWQIGLALLHLSARQSEYSMPTELQDLRLYEEQVGEVVKQESSRRATPKSRSLAHLWRFELVLVELWKFSPRDWHNLDAPSLLNIWSCVIREPQDIRNALAEIGNYIPDKLSPADPPKALSRVTKVWTLHAVLHRSSLYSFDTGVSNDIELEDVEIPAYRALRFLFSRSVLALSALDRSATEEVERTSAMCLSQMQSILNSGYPVDRQVAAAMLHLHHVGDERIRTGLHKQGAMTTAWRQTLASQVLQLHNIPDIVMLVGFLRAVPRFNAREGGYDSTWSEEAISEAARLLTLAEERVADSEVSLAAAYSRRDPSQNIKSDLLRALATASLRLDRVDIALDCLHDARLDSRHAISVLNELSTYLGQESGLPVPERNRLVAICAKFAEGLAQRFQTYIERQRIRLLVPFIQLLSHHLHLEEAAALVLALQNPAHLGETVLSEFLRKLSFHRQGVLALAIYNKIPPFDVTDYHRAALLSSPWKGLSDVVWEQLFEDGRKKQLHVRLLNARLLHYANQPQKTKVSSRRILLDHADAINVLGIEPTSDTDNILFGVLIKAGRLRHAYDVYERLRKAASAHTSTILNHLLMAAPKPRADWRSIGPVAQHNRVVKALQQMTEEHNMPMNGVTANILLRANLKWGEMSKDAVWAALKAGLENAEERDWTTELRPLFRMVVGFFSKRKMKEDARKAVFMMKEMRMSRIGR